jgi:hypothetical protein
MSDSNDNANCYFAMGAGDMCELLADCYFCQMPLTRNDGLDYWANLALHHLGISSLTTFLVFVPSAGDLVEKGVMRRLPDGFDGNTVSRIGRRFSDTLIPRREFLSYSE